MANIPMGNQKYFHENNEIIFTKNNKMILLLNIFNKNKNDIVCKQMEMFS
jgi:hypothetical protein